MAASSLSFADFPLLGPFSQASSSTGAALKAASACFLWHVITAWMALLKALAMASAHLSVAATFGADGSSLLPGTHPVSSLAQDVAPPASLQSKCLPGPGGVAIAPPAVRRSTLPRVAARRRFMGFLRWCLPRGGRPGGTDYEEPAARGLPPPARGCQYVIYSTARGLWERLRHAGNGHRAGTGQVGRRVDRLGEARRDAEDADQRSGLRGAPRRQRSRGDARRDDGPRDVVGGEGARGPLAAARGAGHAGAVRVQGARYGEARRGTWTRRAGQARRTAAAGARRQAVAPPGEGVERLVPAEAAEDVHLTGQVDRGLRDRARIEHEGDRQGADVAGGRGRTVVAGRIVAIDRGVARRAGEAVVGAAVARVGGRIADRAGLDEGLARTAARAVRVGDAPEVGIRTAHAYARVARAGLYAIVAGSAAANRVGRLPAAARAAARIVDALPARAVAVGRARVVMVGAAGAAVASRFGGRGPGHRERGPVAAHASLRRPLIRNLRRQRHADP